MAAARGRAVQAGVYPNPELQVSVENVAGSGAFRGIGGAELTVGVAQRFELGGGRGVRWHWPRLRARSCASRGLEPNSSSASGRRSPTSSRRKGGLR